MSHAPEASADAELQRAALGAIAHDLSTVTAALALRASALAARIPDDDARALRSLGDELRDQGRLARLVGGYAHSTVLSPLEDLTVMHWWRIVAHVTANILPRGVLVTAEFDETLRVPAPAHVFTVTWLAACRTLAEEGVVGPCEIVLGTTADRPAVIASCPVLAFPVRTRRRPHGRWQRFGEDAAAAAGASLGWWVADGDRRLWSYEAAPQEPPTKG